MVTGGGRFGTGGIRNAPPRAANRAMFPQMVGNQTHIHAVFAPSVGSLGRLRASCTARMTRHDGLGSPFSTRPLPCDHSQPLKPEDEGRRVALITRPSTKHMITPRNRTTRAPTLAVVSVPIHRPWSILTSPATMPAVRLRHKQAQARSNRPCVTFRRSAHRRKP